MTEALVYALIALACGIFAFALIVGMCFAAKRGDEDLEPRAEIIVFPGNWRDDDRRPAA